MRCALERGNNSVAVKFSELCRVGIVCPILAKERSEVDEDS